MDEKNKKIKKEPVTGSRKIKSDKIGFIINEEAYHVRTFPKDEICYEKRSGRNVSHNKRASKDDPYNEGGGFVLKERD